MTASNFVIIWIIPSGIRNKIFDERDKTSKFYDGSFNEALESGDIVSDIVKLKYFAC